MASQRQLAFQTVRHLFFGDGSMTSRVRLPSYPKVSVVVCSYNGAKTLGRCLASLKQVDYPDYEVVLVDDGSKDNTQEIAAKNFYRPSNQKISAKYAKQFPVITMFRIDEAFGGWKNAHKIHFADGGTFDQIYQK